MHLKNTSQPDSHRIAQSSTKRLSRLEPNDLSTRMYHVRRGTLAHSLRKVLRAQEEAAAKRDEEMWAFHQGQTYEDCDERTPSKQATYAIDAARSVIGTLMAEKKVTACIVDEAQVHLQSMRRITGDLDERLLLAEDQLGTLMEAVHWLGFPLSLHSDDDIQNRSRPRRGLSRSSRHPSSEGETDQDPQMRDLSHNESVGRGRSRLRTAKSLVASTHLEGG